MMMRIRVLFIFIHFLKELTGQEAELFRVLISDREIQPAPEQMRWEPDSCGFLVSLNIISGSSSGEEDEQSLQVIKSRIRSNQSELIHRLTWL